MAILRAVAMLSIMSRKAGGVAGHFKADVEAFLHAELLLHVGEVVSRALTATVTPILRASSRR